MKLVLLVIENDQGKAMGPFLKEPRIGSELYWMIHKFFPK